ncbi:MAG: ACT domain-containing protein [Clostridia bacterium]|nr:ACT domain-containing protein [Clostridia bacterium]
MNQDYLIIHKSILPDYFDTVLKAKSLVEDEKMSVSDACRMLGISRSTFYKYKDNIFSPSKNYGKKAIVGVKTADKMGVLSNILSIIYKFGANVITINQDMPIKDSAYITMAIDVSDSEKDINELVKELKTVENVRSANIIAVE